MAHDSHPRRHYRLGRDHPCAAAPCSASPTLEVKKKELVFFISLHHTPDYAACSHSLDNCCGIHMGVYTYSCPIIVDKTGFFKIDNPFSVKHPAIYGMHATARYACVQTCFHVFCVFDSAKEVFHVHRKMDT